MNKHVIQTLKQINHIETSKVIISYLNNFVLSFKTKSNFNIYNFRGHLPYCVFNSSILTYVFVYYLNY